MPQFPYPAPQQQYPMIPSTPGYVPGQPTYQGQPSTGQPYQPYAAPQTGFGAEGGFYSGAMPQQNVFLPQAGSPGFFGDHPNLSRGLDNAMATLATMQNGPTIGSNISGVANALLNTPHVKQQILAQRASVPYQMEMMKTNLDLQHAQVGHYTALAQELRDRGAYYAHGGRPLQSQYKVDDDGNLWMMHGSDPATPVVDAEGNHIQARAPQQRTPQGTEAERLWNDQEKENAQNGLPPRTATQKEKFMRSYYAGKAGASAGAAANAKNNVPGNVTPQNELQYRNLSSQINESEGELRRLDGVGKKTSAIRSEFLPPGGSQNDAVAAYQSHVKELQQKHQALIQQRNQLVGGSSVPPTPKGSSGSSAVPPTPGGAKSRVPLTIKSNGDIVIGGGQ